ncbi:hypothetical protein SAMN06265355_101456 [Actinomadura mexicana]|uniref:Uncharacterized protein n=1 Tax=Actinomadura mexicana TaxID=134959 RepID=A0A238UUN5_9ACTN|nr:hypothetical protein SAMN06265355_101456 [Actinomadura mexicana]
MKRAFTVTITAAVLMMITAGTASASVLVHMT